MTKIFFLSFLIFTSTLSLAQSPGPTHGDGNVDASAGEYRRDRSPGRNRTRGIDGLVIRVRGRSELSSVDTHAEQEILPEVVDCDKVLVETQCRMDDVSTNQESINFMDKILQAARNTFNPMDAPAPTFGPTISREVKCECLKEKISKRFPFTPADLIAEEAKLKTSLKKALNEKFVNEYASHFENVRFFATNAGGIFHSRPNKQSEIAEKLQCSSPEPYNDAFKDNDKCKNVTGPARDQKIESVLESLGNKFNGGFAHNLRQLNMQILGGPENEALWNQAGRSFNRRMVFDRQRHAVTLASKDIQVADKMITRIFKNPEYLARASATMDTFGVSPGRALKELFEEDLRKGNPLLKTLFDKSVLGDELYSKMEATITSGTGASREAFLKNIEMAFSAAIQFHPGFATLLKDPKVFETGSKKIGNNVSTLRMLETTDIMKTHFEEECNQLAKNFAAVVCSSEDELIAQVGQQDLSQFNGWDKSASDKEKGIRTIISCEKGSDKPHDLFTRISIDTRFSSTSDYYDRMMVPKEKQTNLQALMEEELKKSPGGELFQDLAAAQNEYGSASVGVKDDKVGRDLFGANNDVKPPTFMDTASKTVEQKSGSDRYSSDIVVPQDMMDNQMMNGAQDMGANLYNNAPIPANNSMSAVNDKSDARREMRELLSNELNKDTVNSLINDSSDEMMASLAKLKEETEASRLKILELSNENEKLKIQAMEQKINALKMNRAALEPGDPVIKPSDIVQRDPSLQPMSGRDVGRDVASVQNFESGGASAGTTTAAQTSGAESASAGLGGLNRALLSSAGNMNRAVNDSAPVIFSSSAAQSGTLEVKSQEVGLDLLKYISSRESDIQTLIDLKTSGILYKYKVLEEGVVVEKEMLIEYKNLNEDVKKLIDTKIAQNKNRANEIVRLDKEIKEMQRVYQYSALKIILGQQMKK